MIALRLFSIADASRQIDVRVLGEREEITLGRDASADWPLADPDRALSRLHLKVGVGRDGQVSATDTSTNGVTSASLGERLPRDKPVRVEPGERLELGPYVLLIERSDHVAAPPSREPREEVNPFAPVGELDEPPELRRRVDPFASGLAADPLADDPFAEDGLGLASLGRGPGRPMAKGSLSEGDVWARRGEQHAGDWDAGSPRPEPRIGDAQAWKEPPAEPSDERGFGFDAPFRQPMLRTPDVAASDLAIPSNWDVPPIRSGMVDLGPAPVSESPFDAPASRRNEVGLQPPPSPQDEGDADVSGAGRSRPVDRMAPVRSNEADQRTEAAVQPNAGPSGADETPVQVEPPSRSEPTPPLPTPSRSSGPRAAPGLFEAFCAGAKLDPAALAGEDQAALMQRLGAVYRHMVLGLSDVLGERTALKNEYRMVRTTIQADENNPFKWAPPQKVATELLRAANDGFLDGPAAVAESYQDVKKHLLCMLAGLRAALSSSLDVLEPGRIEEAIKDQASVLKPRASIAWAEYVKVYGQFRREAEDSADSPVNRAFRAAYEKQLDELDRMALR